MFRNYWTLVFSLTFMMTTGVSQIAFAEEAKTEEAKTEEATESEPVGAPLAAPEEAKTEEAPAAEEVKKEEVPAPKEAKKIEIKTEEAAAVKAKKTTHAAHGHKGIFDFDLNGIAIKIPLELKARYEYFSAYPVDGYKNMLEAGSTFNPEARLGMSFNTGMKYAPLSLFGEVEGDFISGTVSGAPELEGEGMPGSEEADYEIRKAWMRASLGPTIHMGAGLMASYWGMGLLANDGRDGWKPGSARFSDPRGGDRVIRGFVSVGPLTPYNLQIIMLGDKIPQGDLKEGDEAVQGILALKAGEGKKTKGGIQVVYRDQNTKDGRELNLFVADATGVTEYEMEGIGTLKAEFEIAFISGTTTLTPSISYPEQDVKQLGASARVSLSRSNWGGVMDFLYATGDQNFDDGEQNGFRTDSNYDMGLIAWRHIMASQTARTPVNAADPSLVGYPTPGLERIPTAGAASNTIAFFPRLWWQPIHDVEVYGGPLFAFTEVAMNDAFFTKIAGSPRNALDGEAGSYYGTEFDLGLRYSLTASGIPMIFGIEGGVFQPGSAFTNANGNIMRPVYTGRALLNLEI